MTDRELLEMAAKAAGYAGLRYCDTHMAMVPAIEDDDENIPFSVWSSLSDDGDALRLAVDLGLNVIQQHTIRGPELVAAACGFGSDDYRETSTLYQGDPRAATRRAITRAAAEIWRAMK